MYRYSCADEMYLCVHNCARLYNCTLPTHTCGAHTMLGSVVLLYVYTGVQSLHQGPAIDAFSDCSINGQLILKKPD